MPQIAIIQAAPQQAPPPSSPANSEKQQFSPHLDKALSAKQNSSQKSEIHSSDGDNKSTNIESPVKNSEQIEKIGGTQTDSIKAQANEPEKLPEESAQPSPADPQQLADSPVSEFNPLSAILPVFPQGATNNAPLLMVIANTIKNGHDSMTGQQILNAAATAVDSSDLSVPKEASLLSTSPEQQTMPPAQQALGVKPERDAFLLQLQKIIENGDETGKLSITVSGNNLKVYSGNRSMQSSLQAAIVSGEEQPPAITLTNAVDITPDSINGMTPNGQDIPVDKANQNLTSVRHTIQQQYYDGKIAQQKDQESDTSSQNNQQNNAQNNNTLTAQGAATGEVGTTTALPDQTNTFAQPLAALQEGQKTPTSEIMRPVTLPSGAIVHQDEVVRQIIERFQLSRRDTDTRVNIQLHPAELGELKIDLSVKDGSIRANVLASSQVTQEIIEKNISKLRTILENQGFTIEEFSVTSKSDTVGEFDLFDRHLFSQNDYTPSSQKHAHEPNTPFTLEEIGLHEKPLATGVNVTA